MSSIPIRVRLTVAFAAAMVCVIGAMAVLVYVRVGGALMTSVDQTLRAQANEAVTHAHDEHGLVDPDAASGVTLAQVVNAAGRPIKSSQPGLAPLLDRRDAVRRLADGRARHCLTALAAYSSTSHIAVRTWLR